MQKYDDSSLSFQMNLLPYTKALMPPRSLAIHKDSKHLKFSILQHYRYHLLDSLQKEKTFTEKKKKKLSDSLKKLYETNPVLISFKVNGLRLFSLILVLLMGLSIVYERC